MLIEINIARLLIFQFLQEIFLLTPLFCLINCQIKLLVHESKPKNKFFYYILLSLLFFFFSAILIFVIWINFFQNRYECGVDKHAVHLYLYSLGLLLSGYIIFLSDKFLIFYLARSKQKIGFLQKKRQSVR